MQRLVGQGDARALTKSRRAREYPHAAPNKGSVCVRSLCREMLLHAEQENRNTCMRAEQTFISPKQDVHFLFPSRQERAENICSSKKINFQPMQQLKPLL
jgi:hypothetical protein